MLITPQALLGAFQQRRGLKTSMRPARLLSVLHTKTERTYHRI